jgi:hypothetical protein
LSKRLRLAELTHREKRSEERERRGEAPTLIYGFFPPPKPNAESMIKCLLLRIHHQTKNHEKRYWWRVTASEQYKRRRRGRQRIRRPQVDKPFPVLREGLSLVQSFFFSATERNERELGRRRCEVDPPSPIFLTTCLPIQSLFCIWVAARAKEKDCVFSMWIERWVSSCL